VTAKDHKELREACVRAAKACGPAATAYGRYLRQTYGKGLEGLYNTTEKVGGERA
jgi:hypothetical protein